MTVGNGIQIKFVHDFYFFCVQNNVGALVDWESSDRVYVHRHGDRGPPLARAWTLSVVVSNSQPDNIVYAEISSHKSVIVHCCEDQSSVKQKLSFGALLQSRVAALG